MSDTENPERIPSHILYTELTTRITAEGLHTRSGQEKSASGSVVAVFRRVRELMVEHPDAVEFCREAEAMLNHVIRPYTARWHGWMENDDFVTQRSRRKFREELSELKKRLKKSVDVFDALRKGKSAKELPEGAAVQEIKTNSLSRGKSIVSEMICTGRTTKAKWDEIHKMEKGTILNRRRGDDDSLKSGKLEDAFGLALSGGGIRSATFGLGAVTALARRGLFRKVDYLSTVSGGGYFGGFLTTCLGSIKKKNSCSIEDAEEAVFGKGGNSREPDPIRYLRNTSKYLLKGGAWTILKIIGMMLFGIAVNMLSFLTVVGLVASIVWSVGLIGDRAVWSSAVAWVFGGVLGFFCLSMPFIQSRCHGSEPNTKKRSLLRFWETATVITGTVTLGALGFYWLPRISAWFQSIINYELKLNEKLSEEFMVVVSAVAPLVLGIASLVVKQRSRIAKFLYSAFAVSGPIFYVIAFFYFFGKLETVDFDSLSAWWEGGRNIKNFPTALWIPVVFVAAAVWGLFGVNINLTSPHRLYRSQLCEGYLLSKGRAEKPILLKRMVHSFRSKSQKEGAEVPVSGRGKKAGDIGLASGKSPKGGAVDDGYNPITYFPFSEIDETAAPYHLINASVNLPSEKDPELRGRDCDFFLFSKHFSGSPLIGYEKTELLAERDPHLDVGTAMAISGAAASSRMGTKTPKGLEYLLWILNIRLGYWIPNIIAKETFHDVITRGPGPMYLLHEMTGNGMDRFARFLNLSDGGHIENLAIYELLRRKCRYIVSIEGAQDPGMTCSEFRLLQRYAKIDMGINIEIDVKDLEVSELGFSGRHYAFGKVDYGNGEIGFIVWLKLTTTGLEPDYVADYRRRFPDFPNQSTGDQLFEEDQFEAYRALGETAMNELFREEILPGEEALNPSVEDWFYAMAESLLPDNDPLYGNSGENGHKD